MDRAEKCCPSYLVSERQGGDSEIEWARLDAHEGKLWQKGLEGASAFLRDVIIAHVY